MARAPTSVLSIRIPADTKRRLEVIARRSRRSRSFIAAEAVEAYVAGEEWQLGEIEAGLDDLERGRSVSHERVAGWLGSWGQKRERKPPR